MGRWGLETFSDDHSQDWLCALCDAADPAALVAEAAELPDLDVDLIYGEAVERQCLGELIAAFGGHPPDPVPPTIAEVMSDASPDVRRAVLSVPASKAMLLVARIAISGEARVVVEESNCLDEWLQVILDLLTRLNSVAVTQQQRNV